MSLFATGNKPTIGCYDPPPRNRTAVATQGRTNSPSRARLTDLGSNLAVRNDLARLQTRNQFENRGLERRQFIG